MKASEAAEKTLAAISARDLNHTRLTENALGRLSASVETACTVGQSFASISISDEKVAIAVKGVAAMLGYTVKALKGEGREAEQWIVTVDWAEAAKRQSVPPYGASTDPDFPGAK